MHLVSWVNSHNRRDTTLKCTEKKAADGKRCEGVCWNEASCSNTQHGDTHAEVSTDMQFLYQD